MIDLDTFIISDTHLNHARIVEYCNRPENHTELMIENWHRLVQPEDTILHLGDLFMGPSEVAKEILTNLPGNKLFIRGNHDHKHPPWYRDCGFTFVSNTADPLGSLLWVDPEDHAMRVLFSHYPDPTNRYVWKINVHGHIHNNGHSSTLSKDRDYRNVSVEVMNYEPARLRDVLYGNAYQSRVDAGEWAGQTREGQKKSDILRP